MTQAGDVASTSKQKDENGGGGMEASAWRIGRAFMAALL